MEQFLENKEGVIFDMPDADYRKAPGVSNSMLKNISHNGDDVGSPAHFKQALKEPSTDSDALFIGRMVHSRILTPSEPLPSIIQIPDSYPAPADCTAVKSKKCAVGDPQPWHGAATFCKKWVADHEAKGIRPMTKAQIDGMTGIVQSIAANPIARMALQDGKPEVSLFKKYWRGNKFVLRKARLDWVPDGPALVDIKTTTDARRASFADALYKFRYYVQAAYYLDLWNDLNPDQQKTNFVFIAVEKSAPFAISVFDVAPRAIEAGRAEYRRNLHLLMTCMETDTWPAYGDDVQGLDLTQWAYKKEPGIDT